MTDEQLPGASDAEGWRRLHPLSPLLRGGIVLIIIAGIIIANFRDHFVNIFVADRFEWDEESNSTSEAGLVGLVEFLVDEGLIFLVLGGILLVIVLIVLIAWIAWRFSTYRITDEAVEARRGILFRSHRRAPLERIQSVNLQRSMVARIIGLTKIDIVTAGQGGKVELAYLGHRDAKIVREQIVRRAAVQRGEVRPDESEETLSSSVAPVGFDGSVYDQASSPLTARAHDLVDVDVDPAAIAAHALVKVPVARLVGSIALSWEAVTFVLVFIGIVVGGAIVEPGLIFGVIPLLIVMASIMFGQFNKGFNFMLSRGVDAVRIGSGLTSTTTESIPFGRIHAIDARQPLLWRPLKWWKVRITVAGHSAAQAGQNNMQNVVLPVGHEADVLRVIDALLPGIGASEPEIESLRDGLLGPADTYLRPGARSGAVLWWGKSRAGLQIANAQGPDFSHATLRTRRGVLTRTFAIMPIVRAQSIQLRRSLTHRMLGLASIQAHTVLGPVINQMRGIELADAQRCFDELADAVLRVQGADAEKRANAHRSDEDPAEDPANRAAE